MLGILLISALATINRFRGGGLYADRLPGHPRFYASVLVAAVVFPVVGWLNALLVGSCFLLWSWLPWGEWYDLGRIPGEPSGSNTFERILNILPGDHLRFTVRNAIGLIPAIVFLHPLFLLLAPAQTIAYEAGWRVTPRTPTVTGEWITGALWGAFVWGFV